MTGFMIRYTKELRELIPSSMKINEGQRTGKD